MTEPTQAEKLAELHNRDLLRKPATDERASTFFSQAQTAAADEAGGRYAKHNPTTVIGAAPIAYPALPASSPLVL